jgi:hypothetical protein
LLLKVDHQRADTLSDGCCNGHISVISHADGHAGHVPTDGTDAGHRQRNHVLLDAFDTGSTVVSITRASERFDGEELVASMNQSMFRGSCVVDNAEIYIFDSQGFTHRYVQPYRNGDPMPGLHLADVGGSMERSSILAPDPERVSVWLDADGYTNEVLEYDCALQRIVNTLSWQWRGASGEVALPWLCQLRPTGAQTCEVAMLASRHGGTSPSGVGLGAFVSMCSALRQLTSDVVSAAEPFVVPLGDWTALLPDGRRLPRRWS